MIITVSGIDCSGKSTQLERLERALRERGRRVRRVWYRPGYSREMDALRSLVRRLRPSALPTSSDPAARQRAFSRPGVGRSWIAMATLDTLLQYGLKVRAASLSGQVVLCDRYVEDALLDLRLRFPSDWDDSGRLARLLRAAVPRPDIELVLMLSHAEMLRRMGDKNEPFPDAPALRDERYDAYQELARSGRLTVIEAGRPIDVVHQDILATVLR